MDSNFSVKITADISELQSRLKSVEAITEKFKQSMDNAAGATKNMEQNANRGRLVAFAFGQVLRDAGFFAQDFRLGILAISNNIPILIDQLVLLSGVSAGVGSALSLLGSALTAGLTIWAYSAGAAKDAGKVYEDAMHSSQKSAQSQVASLNALLSVARDTSLSYSVRQQAIEKLNESHKELGNTLTVENVNTKKSIELTNKLAESMLLQAEASALATLAGDAFAEGIRARNRSIMDQASFYTKAYSEVLKYLGLYTESAKVLIKNGADNQKETIEQSKKDYDSYTKKLEEVTKKIASNKMLSDGKTDISDYAKAINDLSDSLKSIAADQSLAFSERISKQIDAYKKAISELATINSTQSANKIAEIRVAIMDLNKELYKIEGNKLEIKLFSSRSQAEAKEFEEQINSLQLATENGLNSDKFFNDSQKIIMHMATMAEQADLIVNQGLVATIGNAMYAIGEAFATGGNVAQAFGAAVLGSLSSVLSQLADKLIAAGVAGLAFSIAMKNIFDPKNWALALAAGTALKIAAGVAGGFARSLSKGSSGYGGSGGGNFSPASSPMYPGSTYGQLTPYTNFKAPGVGSTATLETRISGNDLVILMNRASTNRNNYF